MKKKLLTVVSVLMLVLSCSLFLGKQNPTEAYSTVGEAQGFQYETGKYQLDAEQPFTGTNWNNNSQYKASISEPSSFMYYDIEPYNKVKSKDLTTSNQMVIDKNGNIIYVSKGYVIAMDKNGATKWKSSKLFDPSIQAVKGYYQKPAPPVLGEDGTIYVTSISNELFAIDSSNGAVKWTYKVDNPNPIGQFSSIPSIGNDGTIYISYQRIGQTQLDDGSEKNITEGYLYAINPSGTIKWKSTIDNPLTSYNLTGVTENVLIKKDGVLLCRTSKGIESFDKNGNKLSMINIPNLGPFVLDNDGNILALISDAQYLSKFSSSSGEQLSSVNTGSFRYNLKFSTPVVDKVTGQIYVNITGMYNFIKSYDSNLNLLWEFKQDSDDYGPLGVPTIDKKGNIYFSSVNYGDDMYNGQWNYVPYKTYFYCVSKKGSLQWKKKLHLESENDDQTITGISPYVAIDKNGVIFSISAWADGWDISSHLVLLVIGNQETQEPTCSGFWESMEKNLDNKTMTKQEVEYSKQKLQQMITDLDKYESQLK